MLKIAYSFLSRGVWFLAVAAFVGLASASAQTYSSLHEFQTYEGTTPRGSALLGTDGVIYGTTSSNGSFFGGTVFRVNKDGSGFSVLYHFQNASTGMNPGSGVTEGADGLLYGTSQTGTPNYGSVYRVAKDGSGFNVLQNFTSLASGGNSYAPVI